MPYVIRSEGSQFCVYKKDGGKIACHPTRAKALSQQRALMQKEMKSNQGVPNTGNGNRGGSSDSSREFNTEQRRNAVKQKQALPSKSSGGSFPIKNVSDLRNAIQAFGRAKNKAAVKAHIIRRARALGATRLLPAGWVSKKSDSAAAIEWVTCTEEGCERLFARPDLLVDHCEATHTFDDIRRMVHDAARGKWGKKPDFSADPPRPGTYTWIADIAEDWVVIEIDKGGTDLKLWKGTYSITDSKVTFGELSEVERRTVYEEVGG